jgi:hypothetical protein
MFGKLRAARALAAEIAEVPNVPAERRRNIRLTTVFQVAKIITGRFEELCILRDISPNGLKAEIYRAISVGEIVTVEFRTGHAVTGRVVWARDSSIGVSFVEEVSVVSILSHTSFDERIGRIRPPRLSIELPARLRTPEREHEIHVADISQAGAKLITDIAFHPNTMCDLYLPSFDRKRAIVRWAHDGVAGLMFADPIPFRDFALWRQALATQGPPEAE